MKLDKRHMGVSVVLLVGSIVYNVWVFTGKGATTARPQASGPVNALPPAQPLSNGSAPLDPEQVKALPDIALDRVPEWPRNPFENANQAPEVVAATEAAAPAPVPEADPVVATILYSSDRRAAVVNGRVVRIGDTIGTSKVVDILPKAVIIESADGDRRTLDMKPGSGTGSGSRTAAPGRGAAVAKPDAALPGGRK